MEYLIGMLGILFTSKSYVSKQRRALFQCANWYRDAGRTCPKYLHIYVHIVQAKRLF